MGLRGTGNVKKRRTWGRKGGGKNWLGRKERMRGIGAFTSDECHRRT